MRMVVVKCDFVNISKVEKSFCGGKIGQPRNVVLQLCIAETFEETLDVVQRVDTCTYLSAAETVNESGGPLPRMPARPQAYCAAFH